MSEFYESLPMRVRRSLEGVPAHPAAHTCGVGSMLDDRQGLMHARRGFREEGGEDVYRLVLGRGGVRVRLRGCEVHATTGMDGVSLDDGGESTRLVVAVTAP